MNDTPHPEPAPTGGVRSLGRLVLGGWLIAVGGLMLASRIGWDIPDGIWRYWPLLLVASGAAQMVFGERESRGSGFWLLLSGLYCWISVWRLFGLHWGNAWPILVIGAGLSMLLEPWLGDGGCSAPRRRRREEAGRHVA